MRPRLGSRSPQKDSTGKAPAPRSAPAATASKRQVIDPDQASPTGWLHILAAAGLEGARRQGQRSVGAPYAYQASPSGRLVLDVLAAVAVAGATACANVGAGASPSEGESDGSAVTAYAACRLAGILSPGPGRLVRPFASEWAFTPARIHRQSPLSFSE